jgi:hypothetical protein
VESHLGRGCLLSLDHYQLIMSAAASSSFGNLFAATQGSLGLYGLQVTLQQAASDAALSVNIAVHLCHPQPSCIVQLA